MKQEVNNEQVWFCSSFNILFTTNSLFNKKSEYIEIV